MNSGNGIGPPRASITAATRSSSEREEAIARGKRRAAAPDAGSGTGKLGPGVAPPH